MKLTGDTYEWKLKSEVKGDSSYKNAGKLKGKAWKTLEQKSKKKP